VYNYIEPLITADQILQVFAEIRPRMAIHEIDSVLKQRGCQPNDIRAALRQLEKDGYAEIDDYMNDWYIRTGDGATFFDKGGYKKHFEKLNQEVEDKKERDRLSDEKLKIDLANAQRVYKTYFSTRAMAIAGAIVSVLLLLLKLAEVFGWIQ
jgi:hypothetical protein